MMTTDLYFIQVRKMKSILVVAFIYFVHSHLLQIFTAAIIIVVVVTIIIIIIINKKDNNNKNRRTWAKLCRYLLSCFAKRNSGRGPKAAR